MSTALVNAKQGVYLLDTNIVSNLMHDGAGPAATHLRQGVETGRIQAVCISVIVDCELRFGLRKNPSKRLQDAYAIQIARLSVLALEPSAAVIYATVREQLEAQGQPLSANDLLIAAHALALNATLVSADVAFARIAGLKLENWLQ